MLIHRIVLLCNRTYQTHGNTTGRIERVATCIDLMWVEVFDSKNQYYLALSVVCLVLVVVSDVVPNIMIILLCVAVFIIIAFLIQ